MRKALKIALRWKSRVTNPNSVIHPLRPVDLGDVRVVQKPFHVAEKAQCRRVTAVGGPRPELLEGRVLRQQNVQFGTIPDQAPQAVKLARIVVISVDGNEI